MEKVMNDVEVAFPLTRLMCSPIGDGAVAAIVCSEAYAKKIGSTQAPEIASCVFTSVSQDEVFSYLPFGKTYLKSQGLFQFEFTRYHREETFPLEDLCQNGLFRVA